MAIAIIVFLNISFVHIAKRNLDMAIIALGVVWILIIFLGFEIGFG